MKRLYLGLAFWLFWYAPAFAGSCSIYTTLAPGASLPSEATCTAAIQYCREPEIVPLNQNDGTPSHYNSNQATPQPVPSYYYSYANLAGGTGNPIGTTADYAGVTGNFSGSTDDIARWAACKHGISENVIRAQMSNETHWNQNCPILRDATNISCHESGDYNNPSGNTTGLPVTSITPGGVFSAYNGMGTRPVGSSFAPVTGTNHDASWSIVQNKVYYQWSWWPMLRDYTAFALDSRYAEMRGCINGHDFSYFHSQNAAAGNDYQTYVTAATSSPNSPVSGTPKGSKPSGYAGTETNIDYITWGCFGSHLTGDWYGGASAETTNEKNYINAGYGYVVAGSFPTQNGYASNPNDTQGTIPPVYTGPSGSPAFIAKNCVVCTGASGCSGTSNPGPTVSSPPTGTVDGDLLVGVLFSNGNTTLALSGFTNITAGAAPVCGDGNGGSSAGAIQIFTKIASGETGPYTVTTGPAAYYTFCVAAYSNTTATVDGTSSHSAQGPTTTPSTPSFSNTGTGDLLLTFFCDSSSSTTTLSGLPGTQRNLNTPGINSQNFTNGWSDQVLGAPGTVPSQSATLSASNFYGSFAVAFGSAAPAPQAMWPFP